MDRQGFYESVNQARDEWNNARQLFNDVSDPDLIDYAIYREEAARRRYMYLLKQARLEAAKELGIGGVFEEPPEAEEESE
jgi:hypothetical protein